VTLTRRACCLALFVPAIGSATATPSAAEQARIDRLIDAVAQNKHCRFIRNGTDYSPANAAEFLRQKLRFRGGRVKTVHDFIDQIATKSSTTGEIYKVRLADGREVSSADFLRAELTRIEAAR